MLVAAAPTLLTIGRSMPVCLLLSVPVGVVDRLLTDVLG